MKGVTSYCRISSTSYAVNAEKVAFGNEGKLTELYRFLNLKYPKFHKMDKLAKAAFLGVEILLKHNPQIQEADDEDIALLFANSESSDFSDLKFQSSYTEGENPSPSQFVYTLPNILMGELAIRNKWYGESLFFVAPHFQENEFVENSLILFNNDTKICICGWVDVNKEEIDAFFFIIDKNKTANSVDLLKAYNENK